MNELELEARIWDVEQRLNMLETQVDLLEPVAPIQNNRTAELERFVRMIWGWSHLASAEWLEEFNIPETNTETAFDFLMYAGKLADDIIKGDVPSPANQKNDSALRKEVSNVLPSLDSILNEGRSGIQRWQNKEGNEITILSFAADSDSAETIRNFVKKVRNLI